MLGYLFGGDTGVESAADLARKRAQVEQMRGQALGANPDTFGEGISAIGKALIARMSDRRIAPREEAERARSGSEMARIMAMLQGSGGGHPMPSPMPAPMPAPMPQPAPEVPAQGAPLPPVATGPIPLPPSIGAAVDRVAPPALTGGAGTDAIPGGPGADTLASPADTIRAGLIERGLPPHVADGFVMNFQSESGLRPDINEVAPVVPGSRGGYGLAQWTGPRRRELEAFAASRGVPASDMNAQLDFLMTELQGPESRAAQSIMAAPDSASAADAVLRQFLRPASEHVASRSAQYTGGAGTDTMMGQAGNDRLGTGGVDPAIISQLAELSSNPYLPEGQRMIAQMLIQQQMGQMFQAPMSPLEQIQLEQAHLDLEQDRNPVAEPADAPNSVQEYQFYADQEVAQGRQPLSYGDWSILDEKAGNPGAEQRQADAQTISTDTITNAAKMAREAANNRFITGPLAGIASMAPNTDNAEIYRQIDVLKSQASFAALAAMRAQSPTGSSGLGSLTERESDMLAAQAGALDPRSPNFVRDLDAYERTLLRTIHGVQAGDLLFEQSRDGATTPPPATGGDAPLTPEERAFLGIE